MLERENNIPTICSRKSFESPVTPVAFVVELFVDVEELGDPTTTEEPLAPVVTVLTIDVEDEVPAVTDAAATETGFELVEVPAGCSMLDTSGRSKEEDIDAEVIDDEVI